jgi:hypothetical protein
MASDKGPLHSALHSFRVPAEKERRIDSSAKAWRPARIDKRDLATEILALETENGNPDNLGNFEDRDICRIKIIQLRQGRNCIEWSDEPKRER